MSNIEKGPMDLVEPLFQVDARCLFCEAIFKTSRIRPSFKKTIGSDSDFCMHYKDYNPDYYVVQVCPHCGFASTENFAGSMSPVHRKAFEERVGKNWTARDYGGRRGWEEALQTYKLALICAQIKGEKDRIVSGLLQHIAWLYREKADKANEERFLQHALEAYIRVYESEGLDLNNARLMFLIGELNRRLGRYQEAVKWFSRIINDKRIMDAAMIRASREQWAAAREDMLAANMELPDEMQEKKTGK